MKTKLLFFLIFFSSYCIAQQSWNEKIAPSLLEETNRFPFLIKVQGEADLSEGSRFRYKNEKGAFVVETLRSYAIGTQRPIIELIESRDIQYQSFYIVNAIWAYGDQNDLKALAQHPAVSYIYPDEHFEMERVFENTSMTNARATEWGLDKIQAPTAWTMGYTGDGVVIGGQDTGYEWDHAAIKSKYRGWDGVTADHDYNWHDAIHAIDAGNTGTNPCGLDSTIPCDDNNHGTHTMGTMIGDDGTGNQIGVAPDAKWMACRNMERGDGTLSTYVECFEWFLAPYPVGGTPAGGDPTKAPHVINNSWGCPPSEGCSIANWGLMETAINNLRTAGVVVVVSAGNAGSSCETVDDPAAIFDGSFSIGASNSTDAIAGFSSRGPVSVDGSNRLKPNVVAPGVGVRSCVRGGGYASYNGTSMSGPHVAGAVALIIDAAPGLAGQVETIEGLLESTATVLFTTDGCGGDIATTTPNHTFGYGRIDAMAAITAAKALPVEMLSFSAQKNNNNVRLKWETANEFSNDYYDVEHSSNGQDFRKIGRVDASIANINPLEYSLTHKNPSGGTHYYRLKQVDFDGRTAWYGPIVVKIQQGSIMINPNPVVNKMIVNVELGETHLIVYDAIGREVMNELRIANQSVIEFDVSRLKAGLYLIAVENNGNWRSGKIVKE